MSSLSPITQESYLRFPIIILFLVGCTTGGAQRSFLARGPYEMLENELRLAAFKAAYSSTGFAITLAPIILIFVIIIIIIIDFGATASSAQSLILILCLGLLLSVLRELYVEVGIDL